MVKHKLILPSLISFLIIVIINVLYFIYINKFKTVYQNDIDYISAQYKDLRMRYRESIRNSGIDLKKLEISKNLNKNPSLILEFPKNVCFTCVDSIMSQIIRYYPSGNNKLYIVLGDSTQLNYVCRFETFHKSKFKKIFNKEKKFNINVNQPYFYIIDSYHKTQLFYLPNKEMPNETKNYLEEALVKIQNL